MPNTQQNVKVITGVSASIPNPVGIPIGTLFIAMDLGTVSILIDRAGLRWMQISGSPPNNPQYWISTTGNDSNQGNLASPLATVPEALRRLQLTGWTGQPTITMLAGSYNVEGQQWNIPSPSGTGLPILIQGTYVDSGLGDIAPTGGTQGERFSLTNASVTVARTLTVNAYKGMFLVFDPSPRVISQQRMVIDSNGAGVFNLAGICGGTGGILFGAVPTPADTFRVLDLATKVTWSGTLVISGSGYVFLDGIEMTMGRCLAPLGLTVAASAMRIRGTTGIDSTLAPSGGGTWMASATLFGPTLPPIYGGIRPPTVACSNRYDGTLGRVYLGIVNGIGIPQVVGQFGETGASFDTVTFSGADNVSVALDNLTIVKGSAVFYYLGGQFTSYFCQFDSMAGDPTFGENCAFFFKKALYVDWYGSSITNTLAGNYVCKCFHCPNVEFDTCTGANPAALAGVMINFGSWVEYPPNNTITGSAPSADFYVGYNAAVSLATLNSTPAARVDATSLSYMGIMDGS